MLKNFHPLYIHTHFNHPDEITADAALACARLADAGIPLGCQTVLLRGVNDNPLVIRELMQKLLNCPRSTLLSFSGRPGKGDIPFLDTP